MPVVFEETWSVAVVTPPLGDFECWSLDAAGEWQNAVVPDILIGQNIGLKARHPMPGWSPLAKTRMLFTFRSPSGATSQVEKKSSSPIVIDGAVTEFALKAANEVGQWDCTVEYWEANTYDIWGPFPIANVFESDGSDGDGDWGTGLTDSQKKALLIAGGLVAAAIVLKRQ